MDIERALVSKIAANQTVDQLIAADIRPEHFADNQCQEIYETCIDHLKRYRSAPSYAVVREAHPDFGFEVATDSLEYITERFIAQVKRRETKKGLEQLIGIVGSGDHDELLHLDEALLALALQVARSVPSGKTSDFSAMIGRIEEYKQRAATGNPYGILMGIGALDHETLGVQPNEFVGIVGWQGTGKSTLLQKVFFESYCQKQTPLIFSLEMGEKELLRRFDIMALNRRAEAEEVIAHRDAKALKLTDDEIRRWEILADTVQNAPNDIRIVDDLETCTVERVYAEIVRRRPDIVGIDYMTLMDIPRSREGAMWESVTYLTKSIKRMARSLGIPVYGVAQTNIASADSGAKLDNIAYSRSIGQDCDIVLGLYQNDEMLSNRQMEVRMLKNRDGRPTTCKMYWDPALMTFRDWNEACDQWLPRTDLQSKVRATAA